MPRSMQPHVCCTTFIFICTQMSVPVRIYVHINSILCNDRASPCNAIYIYLCKQLASICRSDAECDRPSVRLSLYATRSERARSGLCLTMMLPLMLPGMSMSDACSRMPAAFILWKCEQIGERRRHAYDDDAALHKHTQKKRYAEWFR